GHCTASTDSEVSSGPAGQDVSLELDAVHGPQTPLRSRPRSLAFRTPSVSVGSLARRYDDLSEHFLQHLACPPGLLGVIEKVRIDAKSDVARAVAELPGDEHDVRASPDEQRREGVSQVMPSQPLYSRLRERRFERLPPDVPPV